MRTRRRFEFLVAYFLIAFSSIGLSSILSDSARADDGPAPLAVPKAAALARAESAIKDIFKSEFEQASSNEQKTTLAASLLAQGIKTKSDPAEKYALLQTAMNLAASGDDLDLAFDAITAIGRAFNVETPKLMADLLVRLLKAPAGDAARTAQLERARNVVEPTLLAGDYASAKRLAAAALSAVRASGDSDQIKEFTFLAKEVEDSERARTRAAAALKSLERQPTSRSANLEAGRFRCLFEGDFAAGLPMLVLGADQKFSATAEHELAEPKTAIDQLKLADEWWELSQRERGLVKKNLEKHAIQWYQVASTELDGILKAKAEKRIADVAGVNSARLRAAPTVKPIALGNGAPMGIQNVAEHSPLDTALAKLKPMYFDDFSNAQSGFAPVKTAEADMHYQGGSFHVESLTDRGVNNAFRTPWTITGAAVRVTARSSGANIPRWGITIANPERKQGLSVEVLAETKAVGLGPGFVKFAGTTPRNIPAPSVRDGTEGNTLVVLVKGQYVEIHVNGIAVRDPFMIEQNLWPAQLNLRVQSKTQASFDFEEVGVWPVDNLPLLRPDMVR